MKLLISIKGLTTELKIFDDHIESELHGFFANAGQSKYIVKFEEISLVDLLEPSFFKKNTLDIYLKPSHKSKHVTGKSGPIQVVGKNTPEQVLEFTKAKKLIEYLKRNSYNEEIVNEILSLKLDNKEITGLKKKNKINWTIAIVIFLIAVPIMFLVGTNTGKRSSIESTKSCLVENDWVFPDQENPRAAMKFSEDGTFNSSTNDFGGMTSWGLWVAIGNKQIQLTYTRSSSGVIPNSQIVKLNDCETIQVGTTEYVKN